MTALVDRRAGELRTMANRLLKMANDIEINQQNTSAPTPVNNSIFKSWDEDDSEILQTKASEIYRDRRRRRQYIDHDLFGEPAWDLLLDLFIARLKKKRVSVTSACIASDVPPTTALRWLGVLVEINLVERFDSETDQRVSWVRLTDGASRNMAQFIRDSIQRSGSFSENSDIYLSDRSLKEPNS